MSFHNARFISGDLPNKPIELHAGFIQKGGAYEIVQSQVASVDGEGGIKLGGSYSGSTHWAEWKSRWTRSVTRGTAKLEC